MRQALLPAKVLAAVVMFAFCAGVWAGKEPWEEYEKLAGRAKEVEALTPALLGDSINLQNGTLSFSATDVSLRGNNALPVEFRRTLATKTRSGRNRGGQGSGYNLLDAAMGDWEVDLPNIGGVYALSSGWVNRRVGSEGNRCSVANPSEAKPSNVSVGTQNFEGTEIWQGTSINIPGKGQKALLVRDVVWPQPPATTAYWITSDWTTVSCLTSIQNGTGEGFLAVDAQGNKYRFDWMAVAAEQELVKPNPSKTGSPPYFYLPRGRFALYATRVEDRFGNWVTYRYSNAASAPIKLDRIDSNDGRSVILTYVGGRLSTVQAANQTWSYTYSGAGALNKVTLPDASYWSIDLPDFQNLLIRYPNSDLKDDPWRTCTDPGDLESHTYTGTVTHPSGAKGTFVVEPLRFYKDGLNEATNCIKNDPATTNDDYPIFPMAWDSYAVKSKLITGPGLVDANWIYTYWGGRATEIVGPGEYARYTYGNTFHADEGQLLKLERGSGVTDIQEVRTTRYAPGVAVGSAGHDKHPAWSDENIRAQQWAVVTRQGVSFSNEVTGYDSFVRPTSLTRYSSTSDLPSRSEGTAYHDNLTKWVLGQVASTTCTSSNLTGCTGQNIESFTFDASTAVKLSQSSFGKLKYTLAYNADGTLKSVTDGNGKVTQLADWYRGVPRTVTYPGALIEKAVVDDRGLITAITDENGHKTCYEYDAMGRWAKTTYPSEATKGLCDATTWSITTADFKIQTVSAHGLPVGHWLRTQRTGKHTLLTYYDAMWRPVQTEEFDSTSATTTTATRRMQRFGYDVNGRKAFESYWGAVDAELLVGTRTAYDALGRVTQVQQDSELGVLTTSHEYLSGFKTRITDARGKATTTTYLAFDEPVTDWPATIAHPKSTNTDITRDVFGKPLSITRRDSGNVISVTRAYDYNSAQELCRTVEPETGATLSGYDAAGNLKWSASGLPATTACEADGTSSAVAARRADRTYTDRNQLKTLSFVGGLGNQIWTYTPDGLPDTLTAANAAAIGTITSKFAYNARRLATKEDRIVGGTTYSLLTRYNAYGDVSSLTYPSGLVVNRSPNPIGQPTQAGSLATSATYHPSGQLLSFTYGNGIIHNVALNARQLPSQMIDCTAAGTCTAANTRLNLSFTYDAMGNVTALTDGESPRRSVGMVYDDLNRLITATSTMFGTASYTYSVLDNFATSTITLGSQARALAHCIDANNRLTYLRQSTCTGSVYKALTYDVQGNLASYGTQAYVFDQGNRLREVSGKETYGYDHAGRRAVTCKVGGACAQFFYDHKGQLLYTQDARNNKRVDHFYLGKQLVAQRDRPMATETATLRYLHLDHLGTPLSETNASKVLTLRREYEPYGQQINGTAQDGPGFTGHVQDVASGLTYMQQRYYDPIAGRFLSVDPVAINSNTGRNFGRYFYAANNPYRYIDPDGRDVEIVIQRDTYTNKSVTGTISVTSSTNPDSKFSGFTLEAARAGSKGDKNPIREGSYDAKVRADHEPQRIELNDVNGYSNIQIHTGNNPGDVKGCFAVGLDRGTDNVTSSKEAMGKINSIVKADGGKITVKVEGASTMPELKE